MKKLIAMLLALTMVLALAACTPANNTESTPATTEGTEGTTEGTTGEEAKVMTYAEYAAAELESKVTVECYVQAAQGWWEKEGQGIITVYAQDADGAYFLYEI